MQVNKTNTAKNTKQTLISLYISRNFIETESSAGTYSGCELNFTRHGGEQYTHVERPSRKVFVYDHSRNCIVWVASAVSDELCARSISWAERTPQFRRLLGDLPKMLSGKFRYCACDRPLTVIGYTKNCLPPGRTPSGL